MVSELSVLRPESMDEMEQQIMFEMSENLQKQKQSTEAIKFQIKELLQSQAKLQAKLIESQKNLETVMPRFFSQTSIPLRPPSQPPDPPDFDKSNLKFDGKLIDGTLLCEWVLRCEQFFMKNNIPPEQKVRIISIHMEGEAFDWHCDFIRNRFGIFPSWSDYIVALSARFGKLFDDPLSELMSLKQCGDSVETYLEKFDRALSRLSLSMPHAVNIFLSNMNPHLASHVKQFDVTTVAYAAWVAKLFEPSLLHTTAIQPRAPFSPYQNQNNQFHYNSPNTTSSLPLLETTKLPYKPNIPTETDMEKSPKKLCCEEIQESGMTGMCMSSNGHHLEFKKSQGFVVESDDEESFDVREPSEVTVEEIVDKSVDMIREEKSTLENESSPEVSPQILLLQFQVSLSSLEPGRRYHKESLDVVNDLSSDLGCVIGKTIGSICDSEIGQDNSLDKEEFVGLVGQEKLSDRLSLANYVWKPGELMFCVQDQWDWISEVHSGELQEWNDVVAGHFLFDMVEKGNYLDEVIEEAAKTFTLTMIDEHKDIKTACVSLEMSLNRERLIQLGAPPVFSDWLCAMNRIQVRLKMVLLQEFLWLILFSSKMFKSSIVPQDKNQTNQKLSSYWKLLLRLLYPLHNNEWRSFYMLMIKSAVKGKEKTVSFKIAVTSCSRFCFFSYSSWMGSHNRYDLSSCVLRQEKNYVMALFPIGEALTLVNDQHTLVAQKKGTETSTGCCYGFHADLDLMADVTAGTADISMDEFSSVCKLLFGVFVLNLIADQVRDWSFFGLLLQWKWHPPPQATSEFHQAHNDKPVFHL